MKMENLNLSIAICLFVCVALSLGCIFMLVRLIYCKCKADTVTMATVIEYKTSRSDHDTIYFPILSYEVAGEKYIEQYDIGFPYQKWELNEQIELICNSKKPSQFYIQNTGSGTYIMLICGSLIGAVFFLLICYLKNIF